MNVSESKRELIARNMDTEDFVLFISRVIEHQLQEWDEQYEVHVLKLKNYKWIVKYGHLRYVVEIVESEIQSLQKRDPFGLDQRIWRELEGLGLPIVRGVGNYLEYVLR